jgi:WD40 repeat protein/uncharacterized protein YjbI with pentapeptide repeats
MAKETSEKEFEYDLFLSHAGEDGEWSRTLSERLRGQGIRVWFPATPIKHEDAIGSSRKLAVVWSPGYFRKKKLIAFAEGFKHDRADASPQDRLFIPLLLVDCRIPTTFEGAVPIDFRNPADFDLRLRQLVEAIDLPSRDVPEKEESESIEPGVGAAERGRRAHAKGKHFESEVGTLYGLLGFRVRTDLRISGMQIDLAIEQKRGGILTQAIVECKDQQVTSYERDQILAQQNVVQRELPRYRWICVSSRGFAADTRTALESAGVDCVTYSELLADLVPLRNYVEWLIRDYEEKTLAGWNGQDWFIRPIIETDVTYEKQPALTHLAKWLGDKQRNFLAVLGDLGTGKSTLARFLAYNMARNFRDDALHHPAPVLIPLGEVRKEVSLEGIVIAHFSNRGLPAINFPRFEHLVRLGKIILLFDAFDEMADRVRWDVIRTNFQQLKRAADCNGKALLTCRTHYFKDRTEQVKVIGEGPRLSEVETELYREIKRGSGAQVVYLQEFDDDQIKAYLTLARPHTHEEDWKKIGHIYDLKELAHRPLLLDMIIKSLPKMEKGQQISAAGLYNVYTNLWVQREERSRRIVIGRDIKLGLMLQLAWQLWTEQKQAIHYKALLPFLRQLSEAHILEFGDEEAEDIAREMQGASFLKRDEGGSFSFVHRSFMEYFLARKLFQSLCAKPSEEINTQVLRTRRLDRKLVYFLSQLDDGNLICAPLQKILQSGYVPDISENALQILYWSGRIRIGMEERIGDTLRLREELATRIPARVTLGGANLQDIVLEGAEIIEADLSHADLDGANLNNATFRGVNLRAARLVRARAENSIFVECRFDSAILTGASFTGATLSESVLTGAVYDPATLAGASVSATFDLPSDIHPSALTLEPLVQDGPMAAVTSIAYSWDSNLIAACASDGLIRVHTAADGLLIRILQSQESGAYSVALNREGDRLASGGYASVTIWDTKSGEIVSKLEGHQSKVGSVAFNARGDRLASGSEDKTVRIWNVASGAEVAVLKGHRSGVYSVAFSREGDRLASGSADQTVRIWDVESGGLLKVLQGHHAGVTSVAFSPQGDRLASSTYDESVRVWDIKSGALVRALKGHQGSVTSVAFNQRGDRLASGSYDKSLRVWDVESGAMLKVLEGHHSSVTSVAFDHKSDSLASGSFDRCVRVWNVETGAVSRILEGHWSRFLSVSFDGSGERLASVGDDEGVRLWDMRGPAALRDLEGDWNGVRSVAFSPNGDLLAMGSTAGSVTVWDVQTGAALRVLGGHRRAVVSVAFSKTGGRLASGSDDMSVRVWDVESGAVTRVLEGHKSGVNAVAFNLEGNRLASSGYDKGLRLWDVESGALAATLEGHHSAVNALAFNQKGDLLASGSDDGSVGVWDVESGTPIRALEGHRATVRAVAFEPGGDRLVSGGDDHTVRLWSIYAERCLCVMEGNLGAVLSLAFAPNGNYLVAVGAAGRLQFWDFEKGETFLYRYSFGPGAWLDLLPDGRFDASPEGMRYLTYTEPGTFHLYKAEDLVKEFYSPDAVREVLTKYVQP